MVFDLFQYKLIKKEERKTEIVFHLSTKEKPLVCKNCNLDTIRKYRKRNQRYIDIPKKNKQVFLQIEVQSYYCKNCKKTFKEDLPEIDSKRTMTTRLIEYIKKESVSLPFTRIATEVGCSEGTIRRINGSYRKTQNKLKGKDENNTKCSI